MTDKNLDATKHLDSFPDIKHKNFFDPFPFLGPKQEEKPKSAPKPLDIYDVGDLRIIDTNHDGNYDKGVDRIVKVVPGEKEVRLKLGSKEVKEFEKKYKIDVHSGRQFHLFGAKVYVQSLDEARLQAAEGDVGSTKQALEEAHTAALNGHIKWDGAMEEAIVKGADLKALELALQDAEVASANGYVAETNRWLEKARTYADEAAILGDRKTLDPKIYDPRKIDEIGRRAYRVAIEKRLEILKKAGERGDAEIYGRVASDIFQLAEEGKQRFGLEIHPELPLLQLPIGTSKIDGQDFISNGQPKMMFYDMPMKQADRFSQLGDYKMTDAYLAEAEEFMIERGFPFNEQDALSMKNIANQTYRELSVLGGLIY